MKQSNKIAVGAAAFVILATIGGIALTASAGFRDVTGPGRFGGFDKKFWSEDRQEEFTAKMEEHRAEMEARREAVNAALEAGDYDAWLAAVGEDCPLAEKINEGNFYRFVEAHQKREEARVILEELGIEPGGFGRSGHGRGGFMRPW